MFPKRWRKVSDDIDSDDLSSETRSSSFVDFGYIDNTLHIRIKGNARCGSSNCLYRKRSGLTQPISKPIPIKNSKCAVYQSRKVWIPFSVNRTGTKDYDPKVKIGNRSLSSTFCFNIFVSDSWWFR